MKPQKVLSISYFSRNSWGYSIWNAINAAEGRNSNYKLSQGFRDKLGNIMLAISYRIDFLPIIIGRINNEVESIYQLIKNRDKNKDKYAFDILPELRYSLLVDVDSLIFELRSSCELMEKMSKTISRYYKKFSTARFIEELPEKNWHNSTWYLKLKELRVEIFHHTAPYIDIDITHEPEYDLLFSKENIHDYQKSDNFFRLSEVSKIHKDFVPSAFYLQDHIVNEINQLN